MEDNQFLDSVKTVIEAAQNFLDTDAAYGSDDPRTRGKKERLAQAMGELTPSNVDVPELHVVRGGGDAREIAEREREPAFRAPVADPQRWSQVRAYLTQGRELPAMWIDALHEGGKIYGDLWGNVVFIGENERGIPTTAYLRRMGSESVTVLDHGAKDEGWFTARLPAEDVRIPPVLIVAESPVEALSVLEMHRRIYRDRPDGKNERGPVTVIATEGAPALPRQAIRETLNRGGIVRVATANHGAGELIWQQLRQQYPSRQVERAKPMMEDWNKTLRFNNACYRDPMAAARQLDEVQRQNPPDAQSRAALRDAVRRLGPARPRGRDDYER